MGDDKKVALVVGGTGLAACEIVPLLLNEQLDEWEDVMVIALDARPDTFSKRTPHPYTPLTEANLNSKDSIAESLRNANPNVTHVFWFLDANKPPKVLTVLHMRRLLNVLTRTKTLLTGFLAISPQFAKKRIYGLAAHLAGSGSQPRNIIWMDNVFGALEEVGAPFRRFVLGTGGKHYGMHLGPGFWPNYSSPFNEDEQKCPGPLSYFEMEDKIIEESKKRGFYYNVLRPSFIIGVVPEISNRTQSFGLAFAMYSLILKAQGKPLVFPGNQKVFEARIQFTTSTQIARVAVWASTGEEEDHKKNQAYNVVSCPDFSWSEIWQDIADYFGMDAKGPGPRSTIGTTCGKLMGGEAGDVWAELCEKNGIENDIDFAIFFNQDFFDKSFTPFWDSIFSTEKLSAHGFPQDKIFEHVNAFDVLQEFFDHLVKDGIIPNPSNVEVREYNQQEAVKTEPDKAVVPLNA